MKPTLHLSARYRRSFTLIEMLTVVFIILVLVGLLFPVVGNARTQAKKARAKEEMNNLKIALQAYRNEYGYWPTPASWAALSTMLNGGVNPVTDATDTSLNPRKIRFLEFKDETLSSSAEFEDPWGTPYKVMMDNGGAPVGGGAWANDSTREDGQLSNPGGGTKLQSTVAVYSWGPNKTENNGASDDVVSWSTN